MSVLEWGVIPEAFPFLYIRLYTVFAMMLIPSLSQICTDFAELTKDYKNCYTANGLPAPTSFDRYSEFKINEFFQDPVFLEYGERFCSGANVTAFRLAVACVIDVQEACVRRKGQVPINTATALSNLVNPLCEHFSDIDFKCVTEMSELLFSCILESGETDSCRVNARAVTCLKRELRSCGCRTSKSYSNAYLDHVVTRKCDSWKLGDLNRVRCNGSRFITDGTHLSLVNGGFRPVLVMWVLTVCTLAIIIFK